MPPSSPAPPSPPTPPTPPTPPSPPKSEDADTQETSAEDETAERRGRAEGEHAEAVAIQAASMEAAAAAASAPLQHSSQLYEAVEARHAEAATLKVELQKASVADPEKTRTLEELIGRAITARGITVRVLERALLLGVPRITRQFAVPFVVSTTALDVAGASSPPGMG